MLATGQRLVITADSAIAEALKVSDAVRQRMVTEEDGAANGEDGDDPMQSTPPKLRKKRCTCFSSSVPQYLRQSFLISSMLCPQKLRAPLRQAVSVLAADFLNNYCVRYCQDQCKGHIAARRGVVVRRHEDTFSINSNP